MQDSFSISCNSPATKAVVSCHLWWLWWCWVPVLFLLFFFLFPLLTFLYIKNLYLLPYNFLHFIHFYFLSPVSLSSCIFLSFFSFYFYLMQETLEKQVASFGSFSNIFLFLYFNDAWCFLMISYLAMFIIYYYIFISLPSSI